MELLSQTQIFKSLYLHNIIVQTFYVSNLDYLIYNRIQNLKYHRSTTSSCKGIGIKKLNICKKYDFKNYFLIVKKIEEENLVKLRNEKENSVNLRNEKKNSVNLRNEKENSVSLETDRESGNGNPHKPLIRKTKKWEKRRKKD